MSKTITFLLGALLGLLIGAVAVLFFFGGAPRASAPPGRPIQPPDPNGVQPGTASVVLNQQFFDSVLGTIFRDMNAPAFPLSLAQNPSADSDAPARPEKIAFQTPCDGKITLKPEGSGVVTSVRLENGKITVPLAFSGSYSLGNCWQFAGWAQANLALRFDDAQQTVFGQINVETVNLDGVNPFVTGLVTPLVQGALNQRVNPIVILRGQQIALSLPIAATDGTLNARVKDVRSEIKDNTLYLYITYDFQGTKGAAAAVPDSAAPSPTM